MNKPVAALCVASNSVYKSMQDVDAFDARRDVCTFTGGMPVVAHPPCRAWSVYTSHQAKPEPWEPSLGLLCADLLRECGGVLEQPAHSRLFAAAGLPFPGESGGDLWTLPVLQCWWGYSMRKATWLCFSRVPREAVVPPFRLHDQGADRRRQQLMSHNQRAATCEPFARWLVDAARLAS